MDLIYGNERKILKIVLKSHKNNIIISPLELSKKLKLEINYIHELTDSLCNKGYISFVGLDYKPKITAKGLDYFSAEVTISIELVIKSIFCPIIVAFITTLITIWLKGLL